MGTVTFRWTCPSCNKPQSANKPSSWKPICPDCGEGIPPSTIARLDVVDDDDGNTTATYVLRGEDTDG